MHEHRTATGRLADQRVEHGPRRVGDGEELARVFTFEFHTGRLEEGHRVVHREPREHLADCRRRAAGEIGVGHPPVSHVAAAATGHEDLCAQFAGTVHGHDRQHPATVPGRASRPGRREEPGGPAPHDRDVGGPREGNRRCRPSGVTRGRAAGRGGVRKSLFFGVHACRRCLSGPGEQVHPQSLT